VLSQKGGTGKTTAVRTLADAFRRSEVRTLAVDLDPQGNLSDYFDLDPEVAPTIADVLAGRAKASEAVHSDLIPANLSLAEAELARDSLNPELGLLGVLLNLADMRTVHSREALASLQERFGGQVFETVIRASIAYAESAERARSILDYRPDLGADYISLAGEV